MMTFLYPFQIVTDIKTVNYQIVAYELVLYDASAGTFTLTFPANPTHGEVVGIKNINDGPNIITLASAFNVETTVGLVSTSFTTRQEFLSVEWVFDLTNSIWRRLDKSSSFNIPEPWYSSGGNILLGTNTQIPVAFLPEFVSSPISFESDGSGAVRCIRDFQGFFDLNAYVEFVASSINQDGEVKVELYIVTGTPAINQGFGMVTSSSVPRIGTFNEQMTLPTIVRAAVGETIGLRGSKLSGSMAISSVAPTGIVVRQI